LRKEFVERFEDELDETSLGRAVRRLLDEFSGLRVEIDVAPETPVKKNEVFSIMSNKLITTNEPGQN
jgi:DNA-binding transcriptional regulator WhiA